MDMPSRYHRNSHYRVKAESIIMEFRNGESVQTVLRGVSVTLHAGELTFLIGPSGCGKTTLLSILTGILTPTQGSVVVGESVITKMSPDQSACWRRKYVGLIFQQYNLMPHLTAAENAAVPLLAAGAPFKSSVARAREMLAQLDLESHAHKLPSQLSGGQQQRVAIARALIHNPAFVVCDEPTAALDANSGLRVVELLRSQAMRDDRVVIVVTHDNRIFQFADRLLVMEDGIIANDTHNAKTIVQ